MKLQILLILLLVSITLTSPLSDFDDDVNPTKSLLPILDRKGYHDSSYHYDDDDDHHEYDDDHDDDDHDDDDHDDDDHDDDDRRGKITSHDPVTVRGYPITAQPAYVPCFPAHATVMLESGLVKRMDELKIGHRVAVANGTGSMYSSIFMFTHKMKHVRYTFIMLQTLERSITLTRGHYLSIDGRLQPAQNAKLGSILLLDDGRSAEVINISTIIANGLYNPQTEHGTIVVNGIVASCYTNAIELHIAHALLAPFRAAFANTGLVCKALENGAVSIAKWLPSFS